MWNFFINRRPVAWLVVFGIILMGYFSLSAMPREQQPEITIPIGLVSVAMPGASPADTEELLTKPLEKNIATISDIKNLVSTSGLGFSSVMVEFEAQADLDQSIADLKEAVDRAEIELPDDATEAVVVQAEANTFSVVSFSIIGSSVSELTQAAEEIQTELEEVSGVSNVSLMGGQSEILEIVVDQSKANQYGLSVQTIMQMLKFASPNVPVGVVSLGEINYSLRVDGDFKNISEVADVPLLTLPDSTTIYLRDIATINKAFPKKDALSKLSVDRNASLEAVTLRVFKKEGANILGVVDETKLRVDELRETLPEGMDIEVSNDNSVFIRTDLGILTRSGLQTTIFITLILFLALGFTEGMIAGMSIPLSLMLGFILMDLAGMTINSLTLFALVIALGLMVDTAIIIMEGIHHNMKKGMSSDDAAKSAIATYRGPLIAGTLTTIFAFIPMMMVSGILGEFLKPLPITIAAALFAALFVSLTVAPSITAAILKKKGGLDRKSVLDPVFSFLAKVFKVIIRKIISRRLFRFLVPVIGIALFAGSMYLPMSGKLEVEMFPKTDIQFFIINIESPKGTLLEDMEREVSKVENVLRKVPEMESFLTILGSSQALVPTDIIEVGGGAQSNVANITINLVPAKERDRKSYVIAGDVRKQLEGFPELDIFVNELTEGPPTDSPLTVRITGEDMDVLAEIADDIKNVISSIPGAVNASTSLTPGLSEFKFVLNRDAISYYGLSTMQVAGILRDYVQGTTIDDFGIGSEEFDVLVKYDLPDDISLKDIEGIEVATPRGTTVSLAQLVTYELGESLSSISRDDQDRIVKISADLELETSPILANQELQDKLADYELPAGYNMNFLGDAADIDESFADLFRSMIFGVILIAFTLVVMFNSLKQPFIILLTLPLALIGVFPGLMAVGLKLSFPAFLGVVALAGVVVNDAIVLIDRINSSRAAGMEFKESIIEAAEARLQPIIMTSITTIVGILPLALTNEFWQGLGFSLIFGLAFSTVLTLIVVPVLYHTFEARSARKQANAKAQNI